MDLSTVSPEVLQAKRDKWLKPGSRMQPVQHTNIKVTDFGKNLAKFYGVTPPPSNPSSAGSQAGYNSRPPNEIVTASNPVPVANSSYTKNAAKFYGATPVPTPPGNNSNYLKNHAKFYGTTPPSSSFQGNVPNNVGSGLENNVQASRPISQNTEFQINMQKFYSSTPSDSLQFRKNAKAFHHYSAKERSPLASAGKSLIQ